jgi:hypothetical protein
MGRKRKGGVSIGFRFGRGKGRAEDEGIVVGS